MDDLLILSDDQNFFEEIEQQLITEFEDTTVEDENELNYLGMTVKFNEDGIDLNMVGYIYNLLKDRELKTSMMPSYKDIFSVNDDVKLADKVNRPFQTLLVRLLYLSKRVRPD